MRWCVHWVSFLGKDQGCRSTLIPCNMFLFQDEGSWWLVKAKNAVYKRFWQFILEDGGDKHVNHSLILLYFRTDLISCWTMIANNQGFHKLEA